MPAFEVSRTLVKSPPEVWAELEKAERLAELFGDDAIKITRTEPDKAIEWQGTDAHGRIEIQGSSWGTKVRLTTEIDQPVAGEVEQIEAEAEVLVAQRAIESTSQSPGDPQPAAATVPEPAVAETAPEIEAETVVEPAPDTTPVVDAAKNSEPSTSESDAAEPLEAKTASLWQRLKSMFNSEIAIEPPAADELLADQPQPEATPTVEPEAVIEPQAEASPDAVIESEPVPDPEPIAADAAPAAPDQEPEPTPAPAPEPIDYEQRMTALLDHLGSAHKRPFVNA
jgi:hypothetical protein